MSINDLLKIPEIEQNPLRFHIGQYLSNQSENEAVSFEAFIKIIDIFKNNKTEEQYKCNIYIYNEIVMFNLFDFDKDGNMTQGEVDLFLDYIKDKVTDYSIIDKILPKGSIKCNIFKKLFYEMAINEKENDIYES